MAASSFRNNLLDVWAKCSCIDFYELRMSCHSQPNAFVATACLFTWMTHLLERILKTALLQNYNKFFIISEKSNDRLNPIWHILDIRLLRAPRCLLCQSSDLSRDCSASSSGAPGPATSLPQSTPSLCCGQLMAAIHCWLTAFLWGNLRFKVHTSSDVWSGRLKEKSKWFCSWHLLLFSCPPAAATTTTTSVNLSTEKEVWVCVSAWIRHSIGPSVWNRLVLLTELWPRYLQM